jgi:hypothetical protein
MPVPDIPLSYLGITLAWFFGYFYFLGLMGAIGAITAVVIIIIIIIGLFSEKLFDVIPV